MVSMRLGPTNPSNIRQAIGDKKVLIKTPNKTKVNGWTAFPVNFIKIPFKESKKDTSKHIKRGYWLFASPESPKIKLGLNIKIKPIKLIKALSFS